MTFKAGEEFAIKLSAYAEKQDEIAQKAIYSGAKIIADEIKKRLKENLYDPSYVGKGESLLGVKNSMLTSSSSKSSGDMLESFGIAPISIDDEGNWNTKIGFDGIDSKGVPNQLKAKVMEHGSSKIKKRPFVRPAVQSTKNNVVETMDKIIEEETKKHFNN